MKKIVIVYGRMNPIHRGHDYMINFAESLSHETNADFKIFVTKTQNATTDPLSFEDKHSILERLYGIGIVGESPSSSIFSIIETLENEGYTDIKLVVGGDQLKTFNDLFTKYQGDYDAKLSVTRFANRDKYNISATDMRRFAREGDYKSFIENCPEHMTLNTKFETYRRVSVNLQGHVKSPHAKTRVPFKCTNLSDE